MKWLNTIHQGHALDVLRLRTRNDQSDRDEGREPCLGVERFLKGISAPLVAAIRCITESLYGMRMAHKSQKNLSAGTMTVVLGGGSIASGRRSGRRQNGYGSIFSPECFWEADMQGGNHDNV